MASPSSAPARAARPPKPPASAFSKKLAMFRRQVTMRLMRPVEACLLLLLVTGLMITDYTQVPWDWKRWALTIHIVAASLFFPLIVMVFWAAHRGNLAWSRRVANRRTGRAIEVMLTVMFLCGLWLLLRGEDLTRIGFAAETLHLVTAIPLVGLVVWHSWRMSSLKKLLGALRLVSKVAAGAAVLAGLLALAPPAEGRERHHEAAPSGPTIKDAAFSTSLLLSPDGKSLYSANFDAGTVSRIDRATGKLEAESAERGQDIRTLALSADGTVLAATDQLAGALLLLDPSTLALKARVAIPGRPYGVAFDKANKLFWVSATEAGRLYAVGLDGAIKADMAVAETPKGLAILPDGRLLLTHAMIGALSVYDISSLPAKLSRTIKLAETHDPTPTVSQGLPRVLDRIILSPDLKQAWLPHHLWSFGHPFQFQSIVFPAVSVIWLGKGDEHEVLSRRKQLFKQINIVESGNIQRIASNPTDGVFSDDGQKVYVTMAGSEDLMVFDLSRAAPISAEESGPGGSGGANASQIFALPGENPRGIAMAGSAIYVQNAMGLDLSTLDTGGGGPFAQMSVTKAHFAPLVHKDPLDPQMRRGTRLFHLAKTAAFPDAPMAGDNWMSCSSCHIDGFNYTNQFLFRDSPRDLTKNGVVGHFSLKTFITGDFVAEYIRMIKQTQGGMGFDTRFPTPVTDPEKPTPAAKQMMEDLHYFVTSPGNLPSLSTWLTADDGKGRVDHASFVNPAVCGNCHTRIYKEWAGSMHHLMGESNPYYQVLEDYAAKTVGEGFRVWCMGCHMPQYLLTGRTKTEGTSHLTDNEGQFLEERLRQYVFSIDEGTSCMFCHRTKQIQMIGETGGGNSSSEINLKDRVTYPGEDSDWSVVRWFAERAIRAEPREHLKSFRPGFLTDSVFCSTCHNEFTPGVGAITTSTYTEWQASPFNVPGDPEATRTCQDCHMHADVTRIGEDIPGRATNGGPIKKNEIAHTFVGAQYHLLGIRSPERRDETIALLKTSATLALSARPHELVVKVTNTGAGHHLPTGVSDFRQLWLQVTAVDATGRTVLSSGALDAGGHLDPDARLFHQVYEDGQGHHAGLAFWNYRKMPVDTRIRSGQSRDEAFALPLDTVYPVKATVRLMFRTFPQAVTDIVRQRYPDMPAPDAVELNRLEQTIGNS